MASGLPMPAQGGTAVVRPRTPADAVIAMNASGVPVSSVMTAAVEVLKITAPMGCIADDALQALHNDAVAFLRRQLGGE